MLVGSYNFAQLTAWALYFDCAALQAVHFFAEKNENLLCSYMWTFWHLLEFIFTI